jgi:hypothetical protein
MVGTNFRQILEIVGVAELEAEVRSCDDGAQEVQRWRSGGATMNLGSATMNLGSATLEVERCNVELRTATVEFGGATIQLRGATAELGEGDDRELGECNDGGIP